jgi:tetratricopeptide (TPR) repeat protein
MRKTECTNCDNKSVPLNETITIDEKDFCHPCFEANFSDEEKLNGKKVEKKYDPTICSACSKDFEEKELNKIGVYPYCNDCETEVKNRVFPNWVKAFFAAIILIVLFSFYWNWQYYDAYSNIKESNTYFDKGDFANATKLMTKASKEVPEVEDLKTLSAYYNGFESMAKNDSEKALSQFTSCLGKVPPEYNINFFINQAKIGVSFDKKDYNGFLSASKEILKIDSTSADSYASVASAYACIYATTNDESAKKKSYEYLKKAHAIDNTSAESKFYYNFLEYRMYAHKVIRREDFIKQFPNGWTKK